MHCWLSGPGKTWFYGLLREPGGLGGGEEILVHTRLRDANRHVATLGCGTEFNQGNHPKRLLQFRLFGPSMVRIAGGTVP
jgi:hypothetical protein